jgi:hypothetical protein
VTSAESLAATKPRVLTYRVMEEFLSRVLLEDRPISTLTLVSPWISPLELGHIGLSSLRDRIHHRHIRTLILTRPPLDEWHSNALDLLKNSPWVSICVLPDLHAKIFLCEAVPVGFGLIGSANLTAKSLTNFEVAVLFEGRGIFSPLLKELRILAWNDLRRLSHRYE